MHDYLKEIERRERVENLKRDIKIFIWPALIVALGLILYSIVFYYLQTMNGSLAKTVDAVEKSGTISKAIDSITHTEKKENLPSQESEKIAQAASNASEQTNTSAIPENAASSTETLITSQKNESSIPAQANSESSVQTDNKAVASTVTSTVAVEQNSSALTTVQNRDANTSQLPSAQKITDEKAKYIQCYIIETSDLNVRSEPKIEDNIVGKVREGEEVCAYEIDKGWIRTDMGWIYAKRLKEIEKH